MFNYYAELPSLTQITALRYNLFMPHTLDEVRQIALELPYDDRWQLAETLHDSLHPPGEDLPQQEINAAWEAEIKKRLDEIDSGAVELIPGEVVEERMFARIKAARQK